MFGMMKLCDFRHSPSIFIKVVATFHEISSPILKCSVFFGWFPKLNIMMLRREVATSFTQTIFRSQSYPSRMYIPINRRMKQACCQVFSGWPLFKVLGQTPVNSPHFATCSMIASKSSPPSQHLGAAGISRPPLRTRVTKLARIYGEDVFTLW